MLNDKSQRSGGTPIEFPGGKTGKVTAAGANTVQKGGGLGVPKMATPATGNTNPSNKGAGGYKGIPDGG